MGTLSLSLAHIFEYAQCSPTTRNYVEGEQVLNCKHLILCGKFEQNSSITIKGLVIQSTHIQQSPHEVTGELIRQNDNLKIIKFTCTCKAGNSEACKHVVAVLLNLNRTCINNIDQLSKTDVQCEWSKLKEPSLSGYKPVSVEEFCCVKKLKVDLVTTNEEEIRSAFASIAPQSALALHRKGRQSNVSVEVINDITPKLLLRKEEHFLIKSLSLHKFQLKDCCEKTFSELSTDIDYIKDKSLTDKTFWSNVRQFRITGSRCYSILIIKI